MRNRVRHAGLTVLVLLGALDRPAAALPPAPSGSTPMSTRSGDAHYSAVAFSDVPGWSDDDHAAAFAAFCASCAALADQVAKKTVAPSPDAALGTVCAAALTLTTPVDRTQARGFFETHFLVRSLGDVGGGTRALLTAYYEPIVAARRLPAPGFQVPLHRRPKDLVNIVDEADRAGASAALSHARKSPAGLVPFPTRQQIDEGALGGLDLEIFYVADEVERFLLQVQGSGVIELADGTHIRVTYDGKNGHPYTSVGRYMIDSGLMGADQMSLQSMARWLRADPARGRHAIWQNKSYVFFRELQKGASGPIGVLGVPLTPLRSLAVDPAYHALGLPIFVDAPELTHVTGKPFRQLMVSQDVGSAIKGAERGDIYAGSGPVAGAIAGVTKHPGRFFVLVPKTDDSPAARP